MHARSNGQHLLGAIIQRTRQRDVAARCGVHESRVSEWMSGVTTPSDRARAKLWAVYQIPVAAWDEARNGPARHA